MLPCVSRYAVAAIRPDPAVPSRRGDHARAEILATPTQIAHRVFPGSGTKTQETPRQRHDRGTLHGRPPFLTSTLPADPRFSAPQNPARVVGSGYIQFPPQRPFAGPLLTQPPTVSVRDPRSAKRSASKSSAIPVASQDAPRDARGDSHGACRPRVEQMHLDAATDERARAPPSRLDLWPSDRRLPPARASPSPLRIHPRTNDDSKTITPRSGKTPTSPRVLRPRAPLPRSSRGTTASLPPSSTSSTTSSNTSSRRRSSSTSNTARRRRSSTSNTTASRTASPPLASSRRLPRATSTAPFRRRPWRRRSSRGRWRRGASPRCPRRGDRGRGRRTKGRRRRRRGPACPRRALAGQPARAAPAAQKPRKMLPGRDRRGAGGTPARGARGAETPPASVIRAAQSDAPVSKSQAKRNRKKLREAGGA